MVLNEWTYLLHHVLSLQERKMELERVAAKPDSPDSSVPIHWD